MEYPVNLIHSESKAIWNTIFTFILYGIFLLFPWYYDVSGELQPVDLSILMLSLFSGFLIYQRHCINLLHHFYSTAYLIIFFLLMFGVTRFIFGFVQGEMNGPTALLEICNNFYYFTLLTLFLWALVFLYQKYNPQEFYQIVLNCLLISTILPLITLIIYGPDYGLEKLKLIEPTIVRPVLTFNNANQLGFFAFINLSLFFYLSLFMQGSRIKIKKYLSLFIININFIFLILSVSRAAIPAILLYIICYDFIFEINFIKRHPLIFGAGMFFCLIIGFASISFYHHFLLVQTHIARATQLTFMQDLYMRSMEGVSYNFKNMYLLIFGNGSITNPFRPTHLEFHNNFIFIFNQLGLIGLSLYCYLMIFLIDKLFKRGWIYLLPLICYLVYSDLHYAFRARMNWVFFAMIIFILIDRRYHLLNDQHDKTQILSEL